MGTPLTGEVVASVVADPRAQTDLPRYFSSHTGRWFERLDGGGDRPEVRDRVTAADLVAVQTLSVDVPIDVGVDLLEGDLGRELSVLLAAVPTSVDLGTDHAAPLIAESEAAWQAWELLYKRKKMGKAKISKLLARKRPRLIPVYDDVVACAIGDPPLAESWNWFQETIADDRVRSALTALRAESGLATAGRTTSIGLPRVLDVVLWMRHHEAHRGAGEGCPGLTAEGGNAAQRSS